MKAAAKVERIGYEAPRLVPRESYEQARAELGRLHRYDSEGYYEAEAQLNMRHDKPLSDDNVQALVAANRAAIDAPTTF